jgi:cytochrome P450
MADPRLRAGIGSEPPLALPLVEEVARLHPTTHMLQRVATNATELAGAAIPQGAPVRLCVSAANRDPDVFALPDQVDLRRGASPHFGFGGGPHACLGADLARAIVPPIVRMLLEAGIGGPFEGARFDGSVDALVPSMIPISLTAVERT